MVWTSSLRVTSSSSLSANNPDARWPGTTTLNTSLTDQDSSSRFPSTSSRTAVDQAWRTESSGSSMTKRKEIPPAQQEGWENTKQRVMQAASSVLGTTLDVTHEALVLSTELLELSPIPGLQTIAKTLLHIWDSLEDVDICRLQCLHLTERCADILLSVRQEIQDAGGLVGEELKFPIQKLSQSFRDVFVFLQKQARRPFLQRYLKRDDIRREIEDCRQSLREALGMFSFSIQIRILKEVQESNVRQGKEAKAILEALGRAPPSRQEDRLPKPSPAPILPGDPEVSKQMNLSSSSFDELVATQNSIDAAVDAAMLRNVLKSVVAAGTDLVMVETLGVERNEMAEAIKTLQRALERMVPCQTEGEAITNERFLDPSSPRARFLRYLPRRSKDMAPVRSSSSLNSAEEEEANRIDREFLESGIGALRRMSEDPEAASNLPNWTITKFEVEFTRKIGLGFFSDVYKGTWRSRTVAIKVLAQTTPRDLFVKEVEIWQKLHHPNILELYGASSTSGDPPWFLVSPYMKEGSLVEFLRRAEADLRQPLSITGRDEDKLDLDGRDVLELMSDIAKGMSYLHSHNIIHGDLKASNILVTDQYNCVITDFGQSDMKSEAYRLSGTPLPHGTLRWQAPELMSGVSHLTTKIDVYAFAICCVEILSMGRVPWPLADDVTVRNYVLDQNARPPIPCTPFNLPGLHDLIHQCWNCEPIRRPTFSQIVRDIKAVGKREGMQEKAMPSPRQTTSPMSVSIEGSNMYPTFGTGRKLLTRVGWRRNRDSESYGVL